MGVYVKTQELRIHGVSGTPPRDMLYTDPVTSSPPSQGTKIYRDRPSDPDFEVSGFHWASLDVWGAERRLFGSCWRRMHLPMQLDGCPGGDVTQPNLQPSRSADQSWYLRFGRAAVRAASMALTALFVSQGVRRRGRHSDGLARNPQHLFTDVVGDSGGRPRSSSSTDPAGDCDLGTFLLVGSGGVNQNPLRKREPSRGSHCFSPIRGGYEVSDRGQTGRKS